MHQRLESSSTTNDDHLPMIVGTEKGIALSNRMSDEKDVSTGYSRWSSSTDNVQLTVNGDDKPRFLRYMNWKRWILAVIGSAVIFLILGYVFGYLTRLAVVQSTSSTSTITASPQYTDDSYQKLSELIDTQSIAKYVEDYRNSGKTYHAGSSAVNVSLHELDDVCRSHGLRLTAVSSSKVLLSRPATSNSYDITVERSNTTVYRLQSDARADTLKPFVAYTSSGNVKGSPVYAAYGQNKDFKIHVNYTGSVCFIRYGRINPYFKIAHAASHGCAGVVLFPHPDEFPGITSTDVVLANAKRLSGDPQTPGLPTLTSNSYRLNMSELYRGYIPPNIPVMSASPEMVKKSLESLVLAGLSGVEDTSSLIPGPLSDVPSNDTQVTLAINNDFLNEHVSRSLCATRGSVETDKFVIVGTHHDEAGSGNINPATGQAVMREMLRLLAEHKDVYQPRRSIVFMTTDASYLDIENQEFIEENLREYGERLVAYVALTGTLSPGSRLLVKSSPPLKKFINDVTLNFPQAKARYTGLEGTSSYRNYFSSVAAPVIEMSFSDKEPRGLDSLPILRDEIMADTTEDKVKMAAQIHLQTIMRLAGDPLLPFNVTEIRELYQQGLAMVQSKRTYVSKGLLADLTKSVKVVSKILTVLDMKLKKESEEQTDDLTIRRLNDALTGVTRSCVLPHGVPMIDPNDSMNVIRNLNNRNLLLGSTSTDDNTLVAFPGLYELFTLSDDPKAAPVSNEIIKHVSEIMASLNSIADYSRRAIADPM